MNKEDGMSTIKQAVDDLLNPGLSAQASLDAHFAPDFHQRVNGKWINRAAFFDAIMRLRASLAQATVTVLDELGAGEHYAERHRISLLMRDGQAIHQEVYLFARRDRDGRFVRIEEVTMAVSADQDSGGPSFPPESR
ncbi:nuclear transport factor 2 family protein [Oxalobacteraceae bacterium A2-2]